MTVEETGPNDFFGAALAPNQTGNVLFVGAPKQDDGGVDSGKVFFFSSTDLAIWDNVGTIQHSDADGDDYFGAALALSEDGRTLVIGAPLHDGRGKNSGAVYFYRVKD